MFSLPVFAQGDGRLDGLYDQLEQAEPDAARRIGKDILMELSKSGSPAMDLLLRRGRDAMQAGDTQLAIEHFTALTDHAPDFAEGWHARALAYVRVGLYGPALADLERALIRDPRNFTAIYSLATLLEELGQPQMAQAAYLRLQAIHPDFEDVSTALDRLDAEIGSADL